MATKSGFSKGRERFVIIDGAGTALAIGLTEYRFRLLMRVAITVVVVKGHPELRGSSSNEMLELIPYSSTTPAERPGERERASQISGGGHTCCRQLLICLRVPVLRLSWREV